MPTDYHAINEGSRAQIRGNYLENLNPVFCPEQFKAVGMTFNKGNGLRRIKAAGQESILRPVLGNAAGHARYAIPTVNDDNSSRPELWPLFDGLEELRFRLV